MKVLVTGGTGYIGSHVVVELLKQNHECVVLDNLSNSNESVLDSIKKITGIRPIFYKVDMLDKAATEKVFEQNNCDAVIHMAGFKAVGESVEKPLLYYRNNLDSTLNLIECMKKHGCKNLVFSSSATVYGKPESSPVNENAKLSCANPYGWTKFMNERILSDICNADKSLNVALLRYFNPIGAHESGLIGENPNDIPNNLAPYLIKVIMGELPKINVFGNDYDTPDGTGVRDYIHVVDLAKGHILALNKLATNCGLVTYNLGTGKGYSVLDVIDAFSRAWGKQIPYSFAPRRAGDVDLYFADPSKANRELGFKCEYNLDDMARDSVNFALTLKKARQKSN
ncbi:MAG TPA: UDP-glucose 4-epimerase GalE [Eubacteriales bacterium]|mgnify:CR=1 FL=1|nr:UDP-glucose 4-epimerase GalE [Eubacteriales bacterium]